MEKVLEVIWLQKTFFQKFKIYEVLKWVNLTINKGEVYWFLWPNGSWKTTTLKSILGFLKPDEWEVKLFWDSLTSNKSLYKRIGYAPENAYFYDHLNGIEFLMFMWELAWMTKQECEKSGTVLLEKLGLAHAKDKYVKSYSKWMKQRLCLAASLINDPEVVFWDEPMSWLDPLGRVVVKNLMLELKQAGKTLFFNTHILSDVHDIADRFGIIYNWVIIVEDEIKNLEIPLEEYFRNKIQEVDQNVKII